MPLTVKDILEKTFKRSFKGYDEDEVDRFLDQVIDEIKVIQAENESLKAELAETSERLNRVSETETTIMNTLVSAQKSSERLLAEAARKAELIIDSAQTTATRRAEQSKAELVLAEKRLEELKANASQFAESFANLVNSQAASFEKAYRSYFGEPEQPSGINTEATKRISADVETGLKDIGAIGSVPGQNDAPPVSRTQDDEPENAYGLTDEPAEAVEIAEALPAKADMTAGPAQATEAFEDESLQPDKGMLSLQEINKALKELEEQDGSILDDGGEEDPSSKPRYDDYSWLYDSDGTQSGNDIVGKDDEELKSLIDEVID